MGRGNKFLGRHIMVKGKYVSLILEGKKSSTIRLGNWIPKYKEVILHGGGRPFAIVEITEVVQKKVRELTDEDAIRDGMKDLNNLKEELRKVYGDLKEDDVVTIIHFKLKKKLTELDIRDPYMGLKPVEIARLALRYLKNLNDDEKNILMTLTKSGSIREASLRLYGDINSRWRIRKVVKKALKELINRGIVGPRSP